MSRLFVVYVDAMADSPRYQQCRNVVTSDLVDATLRANCDALCKLESVRSPCMLKFVEKTATGQ
jgi:hypothetical protein